MQKLHETYHLTITTLTPLHIGTGRNLLHGYDYVVHNRQTWIIDRDALAAAIYDRSRSEFDDLIKGAPADDLLTAADFRPDSPLFRYVLPGEPRSGKTGAEIQEQFKDAWDRPYIPGSSLKGAIRTALAFAGWLDRKLVFKASDVGNKRKTAGQPLEQKLFYGQGLRPDPNHDLLRILQVGDSAPDEQRRMTLQNVRVITGTQSGSPIELETVPAGVTFSADLVLDGYLRREEVARRLGWQSDQLKWVRGLRQAANHLTRRRLSHERQRWGNADYGVLRSNIAKLIRIFEQLDRKTEFMLQLGWGGGWDSKTFGDVLTEDSSEFEQVVRQFEDDMDRQGSFEHGDRFPKSRRLIVNEADEPIAPLGWIRVKMERSG